MPDFGIRHPDWTSNVDQWLTAWDFYRSGIHVLQPGREVRKITFVSPSDDLLDGPRDEPRRRRVNYVEYGARSYLESHIRESRQQYLDRVSRAVHYPLFRSLVDTYASATLRTAPQRGAATEPWQTYWDDTDLSGDGIDAFIRTALTLALVYGKVFAITDYTYTPQPAPSRMHALANGQRAYSYLISPIDLVNWHFDDRGLQWIQIRENMPQPRVPGETNQPVVDQYRIWYRDHWELYQFTDGWVLADSAPHPVGEIPLSVLYARKSMECRHSFSADSLLASAVSADAALFNMVSLLHEQNWGQVFSQLWVPGDGTGASLSGLDVGVGVACEFNAEHGVPLMLSPDSGILEFQLSMIKQHVEMTRQLNGVSRGSAETSREERSAAALTVEYTDRNNQVASLAAQCEEFDRQLHYHVAMWEGIPPEQAPQASYCRDVSLKSLSQQIQDVSALSALSIPEPVKRELLRPLVARLLREQSAPDAVISDADQALDADVGNGTEGISVSKMQSVPGSYGGRDGRATDRPMPDVSG